MCNAFLHISVLTKYRDDTELQTKKKLMSAWNAFSALERYSELIGLSERDAASNTPKGRPLICEGRALQSMPPSMLVSNSSVRQQKTVRRMLCVLLPFIAIVVCDF